MVRSLPVIMADDDETAGIVVSVKRLQ